MYGLDAVKEVFEGNIKRPILVYFDPDVDGLLAGYIACQLLESKGLKYSYYVNDKRRHGFFLSADSLKGYLVIAVDFDISQSKVQELVDNDIVLISLDHHKVQDTFIDVTGKNGEARGIVINNQYPFEPEEDKYLSGAGVVYEAFKTIYPEFESKELEALVGITLLSDSREIENKKARKYLTRTFNADTTEGYMGYLVRSVLESDFGFGVPRMDRNFIDFTFSPRVNSMIRFGREAEALKFIMGGGLTCENTRIRQSELIELMKSRMAYLELSSLKVIAVDANSFPEFPDADITSFIGLLCSKVKGTGKSILGFVHDNGNVTRASFRGRYDGIPYDKRFMGLGIEVGGHSGAFGILNFNPTSETWVDINRLVESLEEGHKNSFNIIDSKNLTFTLMQRGMAIATENCYVRDMYRTYIKYSGVGARILRTTYKLEPFNMEDEATGRKPDVVGGKNKYKYVLDSNGEKVPKYIEYSVDGALVKSFGVHVEDGLLLPVLEKGHVNLYVMESMQ